jgi:hypothetical protein
MMSDKNLTMRIRKGQNEIEISGSKEEVMTILRDLPSLVSVFNEAFSELGKEKLKVTSIKQGSLNEVALPNVAVSPDTSCPDAIVEILSTEWGRKTPRKMREILEAMKVNAIHYPIGTVKGRLTDMTKKGVLRRVRVNRAYGYLLVRGD